MIFSEWEEGGGRWGGGEGAFGCISSRARMSGFLSSYNSKRNEMCCEKSRCACHATRREKWRGEKEANSISHAVESKKGKQGKRGEETSPRIPCLFTHSPQNNPPKWTICRIDIAFSRPKLASI